MKLRVHARRGRRVATPMSMGLWLVLAVSMPSTSLAQQDKQSSEQIKSDQGLGLRYYERARYEDAYPLIWTAARYGFKNAQYTLGLMYLKGEFVEQDMVKGTAWLGVSTEADVEEWVNTFQSVANALDEAQRASLRKKLIKYIEYYGMQVQGISCRPTPKARAPLDCTKASGEYPLYDYL